MKILAIETATESCSVALLVDGDVISRYEHQPQKQAHLVLPMVDELMAEASLLSNQLDAVAFGAGPGSFTGLRIAAAITQAIAVAADLPVIPISTLATLAQGAYRESKAEAVLAAFDARMQEVYWAAYKIDEKGFMRLHGEEQVIPPVEVPIPVANDWVGVGSGWDTYSEILSTRLSEQVTAVHPDKWPHAQDLLTLAVPRFEQGQLLAAEQAEPVYLRNKVAKSIAERAAGQSK